jgi:hypothetical protein
MKRKGATKSQRALYAVLRRIEMEDKQAIEAIAKDLFLIEYPELKEWNWETISINAPVTSKDCINTAKVLHSLGYVKMVEQEHQKQIAEIFTAYDSYIKLLGDELGGAVGLAMVHGWKSTRVKMGEECREKINSLKSKYLPKEKEK